ncbi:hypothetical protein [Serratia sp. DD3]|uniref:hypothetical protein n=1 Tax=Serratia sp. DD3 TaxID=1410619 RepID=UPI0003C52122|nr:hypothetical protein [Serratia sp. DD3]KEY59838.1 hypothetical protein SRDD_12260 [Serratia sp. DD3]
MAVYSRKLAVLTFSFLIVLTAYPVSGSEITNVTLSDNPVAQPIRNCAIPLRKLLASSNQAMVASEHPRPEDLGFLIEHHDDRKGLEFIQIINEHQRKTDSSPNAGHYGWVIYDPKTGELLDESLDEGHPVKLKIDKTAAQEYQSCRAADEQCYQAIQNMGDDPTAGFYPNAFEVAGDSSERYVKIAENRQPFYWAPNKNCAVKAFLVNRDKVLALSWGQNNGFVWTRYIHPATQQMTEGWLPQEVLQTKQQRCDDVRQESAVGPTSVGEFTTREVANNQQRLYFYDAPDPICLGEEKSFIVDGDKVQVLNEPVFAGYVLVRYTHPVTHDVTEGWVPVSGLK